ncbi:MAG: TonB-dependent receptor plug domain-containing protein, partial [Bacteroidales bacterium]|nr:TonB-dependent receptor plug domain-containing protein [Candidatus Colimorpha onthohippi]
MTICRHRLGHMGAVILALTLGTTRTAAQDTLSSTLLREVHISGNAAPSITRSVANTQVINEEQLLQQGALQLSDAVRHLAGVTLKDYGGIGGVKTISMRGLGSQFTTLCIDGVSVSDNRNGQPDLGRFLLTNTSYVSATTNSSTLKSARAAAAGSVMNMQSTPPTFFATQRTNLKAHFEAGSFGLISPGILLEQKLGNRTTLSVSGSHTTSKGNYPFKQYLSTSNTGNYLQLRRDHAASRLTTIEANLFHTFDPRRQLIVKNHFSSSLTQLPGAVSLYNTAIGSEHTTQQLFFSQARFTHLMGNQEELDKTKLQLIGKYQYCHDTYTDSAIVAADGVLHNHYTQQEGYLSAAMSHKPIRWLTLHAAADGAINTLESNLTENNDVERLSALTVIGFEAKHDKLTIDAKGIGLISHENAKTSGTTAPTKTTSYHRLSPNIGINFKPLKNSNLRLRYHFKETYRLPNFSELYFLTTSQDLRPERALQNNAGITFVTGSDSSLIRYVEFTADGYFNKVSDKITDIPTNNMFVWSMVNLGLAHITGCDIKATLNATFNEIDLRLDLNYSFQYAVDKTDPNGKTYYHQIPYTPMHSGGAMLYITTPWLEVGYDLTAVGRRYSGRQNSSSTLLDGYIDQGISLARSFNLKFGSIRVAARVLNLFDVQYEVIRSYP